MSLVLFIVHNIYCKSRHQETKNEHKRLLNTFCLNIAISFVDIKKEVAIAISKQFFMFLSQTYKLRVCVGWEVHGLVARLRSIAPCLHMQHACRPEVEAQYSFDANYYSSNVAVLVTESMMPKLEDIYSKPSLFLKVA